MLGCRLPRLFAAVALLAWWASPAKAEGPLDFLLRPLFGETKPSASFGDPGPRGPMSLTVRPRVAGLGAGTVFCVRLCDGRYFPIHRGLNVNAAKLCSSMCPASKTKLFAGADISRATAADGARYSAIDTAFRYRDRTVENCTCNGVTSYGLAGLDARNDPTLRAGDLVVTTAGLVRAVAANKLRAPDDELSTSALPLGLRGATSEGAPEPDAAPPRITPPATRPSGVKRFHDMFAQRKRAR